MSIETEQKRVRLYACGGAGAKISSTMEEFRNGEVAGFAPLDIAYIDTSRSDFQDIDEEHIYHFKNVDGSGGVRSENAATSAKYIQEILQEHKPGFLNIVISSGSGGSGNVILSLLTNELLKRNENVVVIVVGSVDTRLHMDNTVKTLKTLEGFSVQHKKSLIVKYLQNESSSKTKSVDDEARFLISGLCMLFSGQNKSLDSKDLEHWINFNKVTTYEPQMVYLETIDSLEELKSEGNVISVASISPLGGDTDLSRPVEVQFIGYVPEATPEPSKDRLPLHFVTTDGLFEEVNKRISASLEELNKQAKARVKRDSLLSDNDNVDDHGLVL